MPDPVPAQSGTLRAEYDADHHMLYVYLPNHPNTPGCVKHTDDSTDGVLYDIDYNDRVIGIEVLLPGPLEVFSGDNGTTRTGNFIDVLLVARSVPEAESPSATPRSPFGV